MSKRDFYEILGVARNADTAEIKKAYRKAAMEFHPDRNQGDKASEEKFKEASEAYEVLSDPNQRQRYDQYGHAGLSGTGFHHFTDVNDIFSSFGDLFEEFFGFGPQRRKGNQHRGADLSYEISVTLREAYHGTEKKIEFQRREACSTCKGSGSSKGDGRETCGRCRGSGQVGRSQGFFMIATTCDACHGQGSVLKNPCRSCHGEGRKEERKHLTVKVPPGVDNGTQLLLKHEGEAGREGGERGDLYVFVHVEESAPFARERDTLYTRQSIPFYLAALGGEISVETLDRSVAIQVPPGTETGETVVLTGHGFPNLRSKQKGDLVVQFIVKIPKKISKKQEDLLREYATLSGETSDKKKKGLFS